MTKADVLVAIRQLMEVYTLPKGRTADDLAGTWLSVLGEMSPERLRAAVAVYRRSDASYFPKPGQLRALARELNVAERSGPMGAEGEYRKWQSEGMDGPCPVCGSIVETATETTRAQIRHDHQQHYEAGIGYAGPRTGPTHEGRLRPIGWQPQGERPLNSVSAVVRDESGVDGAHTPAQRTGPYRARTGDSGALGVTAHLPRRTRHGPSRSAGRHSRRSREAHAALT